MKFLYSVLISFFYIGYIKYAPGSLASVLVLIAYYFIPNMIFVQIFLLGLIFVVGFYLCYYHSQNYFTKDPQYIVIDEVSGMMLCLFMLPKQLDLYILSFILFRFFDIYKPLIINKSQNYGFGIGIMADDLISGFFTMLIVWGLYICF
jgi:phosphatidylglycerophosphatase A